MGYKQSPINFGEGTGRSPLSKAIASQEDVAKDQGNELKDAKQEEAELSRRDKRVNKRIKRNVEKGNLNRAAKISKRAADRKSGKSGGKTKVAPTSIPVNDPSMKNYNKAVDNRTSKKTEVKKEKVKATTPEKSKPVKTLRGTGKTYKSAWAGMSAEKKAKFKGGYSEFETKAKDYNKKKDIKEGTKLKEGTKGPTKPYKNPNAGQKGPLNKKKNKY